MMNNYFLVLFFLSTKIFAFELVEHLASDNNSCSGSNRYCHVAWSNHETLFAASDCSGGINIYTHQNGNIDKICSSNQDDSHTKGIFSLAFKPNTDEHILASAGDDRSLILWKISEQGSIEKIFSTEEKSKILTISWHPSGDYLISTTMNNMKLWKYSSNQLNQLQVFNQGMEDFHRSRVHRAEWNDDGSELSTLPRHEHIKLWKFENEQLIYNGCILEKSNDYYANFWHPFSRDLLSINDQNSLCFFNKNINPKKPYCFTDLNLEGRFDGLRCKIHPNGQFIAIANDHNAYLLKLQQNNISIENEQIINEKISSIAFSQSGNHLIIYSYNEEIFLYKINLPIFCVKNSRKTAPLEI